MQEHSRFVEMKKRIFLLGGRLDEAEALAASRLELLRRCEWAGNIHRAGSIHHHLEACPVCCQPQDDGHTANCELAEELGE